jgi:DNA-binding CsgD family transcriptional regulator
MSDHIKLLGIIVNIIIGGLVSVYAYHIYVISKRAFLAPLVGHSVLFNILIFLAYIGKYFEINIPYGLAGNGQGTVLGLGYLLAYLLIIGLTYTLFLTLWRLREKTVSKRLRTSLIVGFAAFVAWYGIRFVLSSMGTRLAIFEFIFQNLAVLLFAAEIVLYIYVLSGKAAFADEAKRKLAREFCWLYSSRYVFAAIAWLLVPELFRLFTVFLFFSLVPYIWLRFYFLPYEERVPVAIWRDSDVDEVFRQYQISSREGEIAKLIIEGKSNREIGDLLFISERTVKNHIYNTYKKMGIKSRYQLITLIERR